MKNNFNCLITRTLSAFLLLSPSLVFAQKNANQGQVIQATNYNSSTSQIGEIKQSILEVSEFQSLNGDCWVRMENQSIAGSDLALFKPSLTTLPDTVSKETFLRQKGSARALGSFQDSGSPNITGAWSVSDETFSNSSATGAVSVVETSANSGQPGTTARNWKSSVYSINAASSSSVYQNGLTETRPKNIAVNFFIKINKNCNFN